MPISGLVVTLAAEPELRRQASEAIEGDSRIEIGSLQANRMAIVLDTGSADEDKEVWAWLNGLPGVVFVDVAMVAFDGESEPHDCPAVSSEDTTEQCSHPMRQPKEEPHGC